MNAKQFISLILLLAFTLLSGCGDDLSSIPDQSKKVPGVEPDSFSFETATQIIVDSSTFPASIYSTVPVGETRYYVFTVEYFGSGRSLDSLNVINSSDTVELLFYDNDQNLQSSNPTNLDISTIKDFFPPSCFDCEITFYIAVDNATNNDIDYELRFNFL